MSSHLSEMLKRILSILTRRNSPTPTDTVTMSTVLSIAGAFVASTCKSGSARVIINPSTKLSRRMSHSLRDFVIFAPMWLPIWVMETSEPMLNSAMPTIIITEPMRNESISPLSIGMKNRHRNATISVIGTTDATDSRIFS